MPWAVTASPASVSVTSGTVSSVVINDKVVTVDLSGVTNGTLFAIGIPWHLGLVRKCSHPDQVHQGHHR